MLRGLTDQALLAVRFGVSVKTICIDQQEIRKRWLGESIRGEKERRAVYLQMWRLLHRLGVDGYERSREDEVTVTTEYRPKKCPDCKDGMLAGGEWCKVCGGEGETIQEVVTKRMVGSAGDPSFLRVSGDAIREMVRLEGLEQSRLGSAGRQPLIERIEHNHLHLDLSNAPAELKAAAKRTMERLIAANGKSKTSIIDARVVAQDDDRNEEDE